MWVLLILSEILYCSLLQQDAINGARPVTIFLCTLGGLFLLYWMGYKVASHRQSRSTVFIILLGAVLFRLTLVPAGLPPGASLPEKLQMLRSDIAGKKVVFEPFLLFDSDLWRFLWEGHVGSAGVNPYAHAPSDEKLSHLAQGIWNDIRDNVNHPDVPAIYPPIAQFSFRLAHTLAPGSVSVMKLLFIVADLFAIFFVFLSLKALNRPTGLMLLYAWNPLVIKTVAGSGHFDSIVAAALAGCLYLVITYRNAWAAAALGLAVLAKIVPVLLLPFFVKRAGWKGLIITVAVIFAGFVPFLNHDGNLLAGMSVFSQEWEFNAGPFALIRWFLSSEEAARLVVLFSLSTGLLALLRRDRKEAESLPHIFCWVLGAAVLLSPTVMPWYVIWILPAAVIAGQTAWFVFSALVCLAFLVMVNGVLPASVLWIEYLAFAAAFISQSLKGEVHEKIRIQLRRHCCTSVCFAFLQRLRSPGQRHFETHQRL